MKNAIILICLLFSSFAGFSQVGIGTKNPDTTSVLDLSSTTKGLLIPRMTTAQRNAIISPAMGLQILNVDDMCLDIYDGRQWIKNCGMKEGDALQGASRSSISDSIWTKDGDRIFPADPSRIGIGTQTPDSSALLDIASTSQGFLMPRMTTAQRDMIVSPASGLQILNLDDYCLDIFDGENWVKNCGNKETGHDTISSHWMPRAKFEDMKRTGAVGFSIGNKGYMGTGLVDTSKSDFWEFNPDLNTWTQVADFEGGRRYSAIGFSIQDKGYLGAGYSLNGVARDFWKYDPILNDWFQIDSLDNGQERHDGIGFSIGNKGYVGLGINNYALLGDFYEYDPVSDSWSEKAPFGGGARRGATAIVIDGKGYVGTGANNNNVLKDFWQFSPDSNKWYQKADFGGLPRASAVGFSIGNKGYLGSGGGYFDFWEYAPGMDNWVHAKDMVGPGRWEAVGFAIGNRGYVGTGVDSLQNKFNDFWEFIPEEEAPIYQSLLSAEEAYVVNDGIWLKEDNDVSLSPSGNVGIGVPNPLNKIDVNAGYTRFGTHPSGRPLYVTGNLSASANGIEFREYNGKQGIGFGYNTIYASGSLANQDLGLKAKGTTGILKFTTNNIERLRITGNGNVGIGIPIADNKLDVNANNRTGGHPTGLPLYVTGGLVPKINAIEFRRDDGTQGIGFGYNTIYATGYQTNQDLGFMARGSTGNLKFTTDGIERMKIQGDGNVGIGISNANNKLDINGNNRTASGHPSGKPLYVTGNISESSNGIEFRNDDGTQGLGFGYNTMYASGSQTNQDLGLKARGSTGNLKFNTDNTERMRILGNGNVGIGTSTPATRLQISNGSDAYWTDNSGYLVLGETSAINIVVDNNEIIARNNAGPSTLFMQADAGGVRIGGNTPTNYQLELSSTNAAKPGSPVWITSSDARLKKDIEPFTDGLELIRKINPVWFRYNGLNGITETGRFAGIIAQEIQKIAPYMIGTTKSVDRDGESYLSYDANSMTYILINAVKEQQIQIQQQQDRIDTLEKELKVDSTVDVADMKAMMAQMQQEIQQLKQQR